MKNNKRVLLLAGIFSVFQFSLFSMESPVSGNLLLDPILLKKLVKESVKEEIRQSKSFNPLALIFNKDVFWGTALGLGTFVGFIASIKYLGFLTKHDLKQWYDSFLSVTAQALEQEKKKFNDDARKVQNHLQNVEQKTGKIENCLNIFDQNQDQIQKDHLNKLNLRKLELNDVVDTCNSLLQTNYFEFLGLMKSSKNLSGIVQLGKQFAELLQTSNVGFEKVQHTLSEQSNQFSQDLSQFSEQQISACQNQMQNLQPIQQILLQLNDPFENTEQQLLALQKKLQDLQNNQKLDNEQKEQLKKEIAQQLGFFITSFDNQENKLKKLGNQLQNVSYVQQDTKLKMCKMVFLMNGGNPEDWPTLLQELTYPVGPSRPLPDFLQIKGKKKQDKQGMQNFTQIQNLVNFGNQFNDQMNQSKNSPYLALTYN
jgi:hypothetical protein